MMKPLSGSPDRLFVWLAFLALSLSLPPVTVASQSNSWSGRKIEVPPLQILSGETVTFPSDTGPSILLLNFSATWCGPCQEEWPILDEFYRKTKPDNVSVLVVDVGESEPTVRDYWEKEGMELPVTVEEEKLEEQLNVSAYPTNVVLGPYGRVIFRDEGFDRRIADIVESYAPNYGRPPLTDGSPMVPEEFRELTSSSRSSRTRRSPELNLSSDSPVEALESLVQRGMLSELEEGLSDTFLWEINPSLYSLLETMRERDHYEAAYASFRSRNPETAGVISNYTPSDTPVRPRSVYRSLTVALETLNRELVSSLTDLVLIHYKFMGQWEIRQVGENRYRFEESWGTRSFEALRRGDRWRFDFPFRPAKFGKKRDLENLRFLGATPERRLNAGVPSLRGEWAYDQRFGYRLEEEGEGTYTFSALIPSLTGFERSDGAEVNEALHETDYLTIDSLIGHTSSGDTVRLPDEESHDSIFHRERSGRVLAEDDRTFELPGGLDLSDVERFSGDLEVTLPRETKSRRIHLGSSYRYGNIDDREFEAVRLGAHGLVLQFEGEPNRLWSLHTLGSRGEPVGFRSMTSTGRTFLASLDEPVSYLKVLRAERTERETFSFSVPVARRNHTLVLREGNRLDLSEGRIRIERIHSTGSGEDREVHVRVSTTVGDDRVDTLKGLTAEGATRTPKVLDWPASLDESLDHHKILRFDGPVEELRIGLKGADDEGL